MEVYYLSDMIKGWFIGNFEPSLLKTNAVEIGVKEYKSGDYENTHFHKIAIEYTVIINGLVEMNGKVFSKGQIIVINPNEPTDFRALEDTTTVVVKLPGAENDKYFI